MFDKNAGQIHYDMKLTTHSAVILEGFNPFMMGSDEILAEYRRRVALRDGDTPDAVDIGLVDLDWPEGWPTEGRDIVRCLLGGVAFDRCFDNSGKDCIFLLRVDADGQMRIMEIY